MIRILIFGQTPLMCDIMRVIISREQDMSVVGNVTNLRQSRALIERADLLLICMPATSSLFREMATTVSCLIQEISAEQPQTKIIVIGVPDQVPLIMPFLEAGADGYVLHQDNSSALLQKVRGVCEGRPNISPKVTAALLERMMALANGGPHSARTTILGKLTGREREVLELIGHGLTNREIAQRLHIEIGTAKNHVHNILNKLEVSNRHEATVYLPRLYERPDRQHQRPLPA